MQKKLYNIPQGKTKSDCPNCGFHITRSHTFESVLSGEFSNPKNGSFSATRITPIRAASMEADVFVPAAQSLAWAVATALPSIAVSMWLRWEWSAPLFIGATTILVAWITAMTRSNSGLVKTEEFTYDASGEMDQGPGARAAGDGIKMELIHTTSGIRSRMQLMELSKSISEKAFGEFLKDILSGRSLARRNWVGDGKPFGRDAFDDMISKLIDGGIVLSAGNAGKTLTNAGRHMIAGLVRDGVI